MRTLGSLLNALSYCYYFISTNSTAFLFVFRFEDHVKSNSLWMFLEWQAYFQRSNIYSPNLTFVYLLW